MLKSSSRGAVGSLSDAGVMDLAKYFRDAVAILPRGEVALELAHAADLPDVIADAIVFDVAVFELSSANPLALVDGFEH